MVFRVSWALAGSIVTLLCDDGQRYAPTYFDDAWLAAQGLQCGGETEAVLRWIEGGGLPPALAASWQLAGDLAANLAT